MHKYGCNHDLWTVRDLEYAFIAQRCGPNFKGFVHEVTRGLGKMYIYIDDILVENHWEH